jgi:hypothetical protein
MDKMKDTLADSVKSLNKDNMAIANSQEIAVDETLLKLDS